MVLKPVSLHSNSGFAIYKPRDIEQVTYLTYALTSSSVKWVEMSASISQDCCDKKDMSKFKVHAWSSNWYIAALCECF